jgi:Flp pilus assembly protein TadG
VRRAERGAAVVETVLVLPLLIAVVMATVAFATGAVAKAVVTNAARASARVASIECGQADAAWYADAQAAARAALGRGLTVGALVAEPVAPGEWSFAATCNPPGQPGGLVTVAITYDEVDIFPPVGVLLGGRPLSPVFTLHAGAEFPEE